MIQYLIPASAINSLTKLLLVNALYFEAKWETPFDPEETEKSDFHLAGGKVKTVPFMIDFVNVRNLLMKEKILHWRLTGDIRINPEGA